MIYWKVVFGYRKVPEFYRSTGGLPEPPGGLHGPHGPRGRGTPAHKGLVHPPWANPNWAGGWGRSPPSFSLSPSFLVGVQLLLGVGLGKGAPAYGRNP
jgi:hypothetical protein